MKKLILLLAILMFKPVFAAGMAEYQYPINLSEGGETGVIEVVLSEKPEQALNISLDSQGQCLFSNKDSQYSSGLEIVSTSQYYFIDVRANDDNVYESNHICDISLRYSSSQAQFNFTDRLQINIADNDVPPAEAEINFVKELDADLKEGSSYLNGVRAYLSQQPQDPVTLEFIGDRQCQFVVEENGHDILRDLHEVTITGKESVLVRVKPVDDSEFEGRHSCQVQVTVNTIDPFYRNYSVSPLYFQIEDNDDNPYHKNQLNRIELTPVEDIDLNQNGVMDFEEEGMHVFFNETVGKYQSLAISGCEIFGSVKTIADYYDSDYTFPVGVLSFDSSCVDGNSLVWYLNTSVTQSVVALLPQKAPLNSSFASSSTGDRVEFTLQAGRADSSIALMESKLGGEEQLILAKQATPNRFKQTVFYSIVSAAGLIAASYGLSRFDLNKFEKLYRSRQRRKPRVKTK